MRYLSSLLTLFISFTSCVGQSDNNKNVLQPITLENKPKTIQIGRFDKDFDKYLNNPSKQEQQLLESKYKDFLPAFGRITINNSDSYKSEFYKRLQRYFSNEMLKQIYQTSLLKYDNVDDIEAELSIANELIAQNFQERSLPILYMHVSGFKENTMVLDNIISLSIDKYLGSEYVMYQQFFEPYQIIQMQPEMVSRDYIKAWLLSEKIIDSDGKKNLLSEIIKEGKMLYVLSQLLSHKADEILIGYTPDQLKWCQENEKNIWLKTIEQDHLYNSDAFLIQKYVGDAPYTTTISRDAPGRIGAWLGWQIVKSYVSKNNVSISNLLKTNSQEILKKSNYTP